MRACSAGYLCPSVSPLKCSVFWETNKNNRVGRAKFLPKGLAVLELCWEKWPLPNKVPIKAQPVLGYDNTPA